MKHINPDLLRVLVDRRIEADVAQGRVGGAIARVVQNGQMLYHRTFGRADMGRNIPVSDHTVFRLASMTKPITAVATLIAVERGLLCLDDRVSKYLPEFADMDIGTLGENGEIRITGKAKTPITVRHILCHSSGIGCMELGTVLAERMTDDDRATLASAVSYWAKAPLAFEPYSKQAYSATAAFDVLGRIIELVTGEEYGAFLKKEIFDPCEMKDTTFTPSEDQWSRLITVHGYEDGKAFSSPNRHGFVFANIPTTHALAGAGLISTVEDYSHFAEMLISNGSFRGKKLLSKEMIDLMATPQIDDPMKDGRSLWGLGVRVITAENDILPLGSFGWSGAYGTHFWIDRENGIYAIYLKNSSYDGGSGAKTAFHFEQDVYAAISE